MKLVCGSNRHSNSNRNSHSKSNRGSIYDRNGELLATTIKVNTLNINPKEILNRNETIKKASSYSGSHQKETRELVNGRIAE